MTRKLTKEYYANKREQSKIHEAILKAIPENVYYHNLIIVLADMLQWSVIRNYKDDVFTRPPKDDAGKTEIMTDRDGTTYEYQRED